MKSIYLDHAANTSLDPQVMTAMAPFLTSIGNPSSVHRFGRVAREAVEDARARVALAMHAHEDEIIFTSGATEANLLALFGILRGSGKRHMITSSSEHHAILHNGLLLKEMGYDVTQVDPGLDGRLNAHDLTDWVRNETGLVSAMWVNNETGTVQPIDSIAQALSNMGVYFHTDAVQALLTMTIDVSRLPVSSLAVSGHKIHGPSGIGALYLRRGTPFTSLIRGGSQEHSRRAGTENVAAIVGLGRAMELLTEHRDASVSTLTILRKRFLDGLCSRISDVQVNGGPDVAPNIVNVTIGSVLAETLLMNLDLYGIAAASGSACTAGSLEPSHVLLAMGLSPEQVKSSVRFSFSSYTTVDEIDYTVDVIAQIVRRVRSAHR